MTRAPTLTPWAVAAPVAAWLLYAGTFAGFGSIFLIAVAAGLIGGVLAAVHHAEVVALRVGEPFGTLVLAVAVTVIEVALIVSLMLAGGAEATALARDTVFAAVMIILTGIVGLCLIVGGLRFGEQSFGLHGVSASLATLAAIVVFSLVLPNYTVTDPGPVYSAIGRNRPGGLRELVISRGRSGYVALYRVEDDLAVILAVRHQKEAGF